MASAPVDSTSDTLQIESIPVVDLRFLSQTDLHALSHCSTAAFDPHRCDDVVIPQIDRSVFNESAGSRKQTYSRLRLAPRKPESSATTTAIHRRTTTDDNDPERAENYQIISLLKELFGAKPNGGELVPIRVEYADSVPELPNAGDNVRNRKRGRPRKNGIRAVAVEEAAVPVEVRAEGGDDVIKDVIVNEDGNGVDLEALGGLEDPYDVELRRRTGNFGTEEELLEFLGGLGGKWGTWRRKKKIVDASEIGDALPKGWKLLLSLKKKQGRVWLFVSRYISPNGRQFASCKEVSAYFLSFFGLQDANQTNCGQSNGDIQLTCKMACVNAADLAVKEINERGDLVSYSPSAITCVSNAQDKQVTPEVGNSEENQMRVIFKCNKCTRTCNNKDDLLHHQLSCHRRKRSRLGTSITDGVIIKGGQYECQFCHKTFNERHRYNGHVGAHIRHHMKSDETSPGLLSMQNSVGRLSSCGVPPKESMMQTSSGDDYDPVTMNANADSVVMPASPQSECKAYSDIESFTEKSGDEDNVRSHDEQDSKSNCGKGNFGEEFSSKDNSDYKSNNYLGSVDEASDVAAAKLNSQVAKLGDENNSIVELAVNRSSSSCHIGQERILESRPCSPLATEKTCGAEINVNGDSTNVEKPNQEAGSESVSLVLHGDKKTCGIGNKDDVHSMESFKPDAAKFDNEVIHGYCSNHAGPGEDFVTEDKQKNGSGGSSSFPISNDQKGDDSDYMTLVSTSALSESKQKIGCESIDEEACGVKDSYIVSTTSVSHPLIDTMYNSGNKEVMIGCGGAHTGIEEDVICGVEWENPGSHLLVPSWKDKLPDIKDNGNEVSVRITEVHCSESSLPIQSGYEQTCDVKNDMGDIATKKVEDKVQTYTNNQFAFGINHRSLNPQERSLEFGSLFLSENEQTFAEENVTGDCNSTEEPPRQKGSSNYTFLTESCMGPTVDHLYSTSTVEEPKPDEVRICSSSELILAFGKNDSGGVADVMDNVPIERVFNFETSLSRENRSIEKDPKEESILLGSTFYSRPDENSLNRVNTGGVWEGPVIDKVVNSGHDNLANCFGSRNVQSFGDVLPGNMWRTDDGNILQSALADTSTPLEQSSSCFPAFTLFSDKGENELLGFNGKYDSKLGFDGAQSSHIENVEFGFLTTQHLSSLPGDSKALSYNTEVGPGFDSSFWLGKDALSLNLASRNLVTSVCSWCRNAFHHEPAHAGTQTGAIGTACPTCSAKVSQEFNFF